jgi:organic radical activating enzyme
MTSGYVSEVFCSNQGEGPMVGQRQVFFRTAGCSATCRWCDTVYSKVRSQRCVIHGPSGSEKRALANPSPSREAADVVLGAARADGAARTVSITGGEPLEQTEFVVEVAERCKEGGLGVYLETNGWHDRELIAIRPFIDVVAMDIKLPSATGMVAWKRHEAFLDAALAPGRGDGKVPRLFVKVVVDDRSTAREIESAVDLVASADRAIPFIIQPESGTLMSNRTTPAALDRLRDLMTASRETAAAVLDDVRVIPQVHKILEVR